MVCKYKVLLYSFLEWTSRKLAWELCGEQQRPIEGDLLRGSVEHQQHFNISWMFFLPWLFPTHGKRPNFLVWNSTSKVPEKKKNNVTQEKKNSLHSWHPLWAFNASSCFRFSRPALSDMACRYLRLSKMPCARAGWREEVPLLGSLSIP